MRGEISDNQKMKKKKYLQISWCFSDRVRVETADLACKEGSSYILFGEPPDAGGTG